MNHEEKEMIAVKDLVKEYEQGLVRALNGVSFSVGNAEIVAVMGPSGCGKSTLLNLIGRLDSPTRGRIEIGGRDIEEYLPAEDFRARKVGFVFQFHNLIPSMTLVENVELPMYSLAVPKTERRHKASQMLQAMGLSERMNFLPTKVSGGERQRAAIARALVNEPRIVLADEPTGNVDSREGERILDMLIGLRRDKGVTILIATHNHEIGARADRILRMRNGLLE